MSDIHNQFNNSNFDQAVFQYNDKTISKFLGLPPFLPDVFLGREADLAAIHQQLANQNNLLLLVNGEGGIGKTTVAAHYSHQYRTHYAHLAWVFAQSSLVDTILTLELPLQLAPGDNLSTQARIDRLLLTMAELKAPCLLVIDNANDLSQLQAYYGVLCRCSNFRILLTTRITTFLQAPIHPIGHLDKTAAKALFNTHYADHDPQEDALLDELLVAVGYNTLVIELLAKNLQCNNRLRQKYSLGQLVADLRLKGLFGLSHSREVDTVYHSTGTALRQEKPEAIIAAMYSLGELNQSEQTLISVFAVLPAVPIGFEVLEDLLEGVEGVESGFESLSQKGWIEFEKGEKGFKCSPVVQGVVRHQHGVESNGQGKSLLFEHCESLIDRLVDKLDYEESTGHLLNCRYEQGFVYAQYAESLLGCIGDKERSLAVLFERLGRFYQTMGDIDKALSFYESYRELVKVLHDAHPEDVSFKDGLAIAYEKLGDIHAALGNLDKALGFYEDDAELTKALYNADPQNVSLKNGLAISYSKLGDTHAALGHLNKALGFYEKRSELGKALHDAHPQNVSFKNGLAISYSKLGETHTALGHLNKALGFYEDGIELFESLHNVHPRDVSFKNGLAVFYLKLGNTNAALDNLDKALGFYENGAELTKALHNAHPQNVSFKNGLAVSFAKLGVFYRDHKNDKQTASQYFEQAKTLWQALARDCPGYVEYQNNLEAIENLLNDL